LGWACLSGGGGRAPGNPPPPPGRAAGGPLPPALLAPVGGQGAGVPADLVRCGVAISGLFDLPPLVGTSLNEALGLDAARARAASPMFWPPPTGRTLVAAVGGAESAEFLRQSRDIVATWNSAGVRCQY